MTERQASTGPGDQCHVVATIKPWNIAAFMRRTPELPGKWHLIERKEDLTVETLSRLAPQYVFFPHWSDRVPNEILERFECVCFHMSEVPYGRGGSPLQNLIVRGHDKTVLTALRMTGEFDAGPIYLKRPLNLAGSAEDIFTRAADLIYDMISELIALRPVPVSQLGEVVVFSRRTPEESLLPQEGPGQKLYDFIRMLDAPTYPKAFLHWGGVRLEFDQARLVGSDMVEARVMMRPIDRS